jgi:uncharacterized protein YggE
MKYIILLSLSFLATFTMAQNGSKNFIDQNYIELIGTAKMEVDPDLIYLSVFINEKELKSKVSLVEMEKLMTDKLTEIGVDVSKDLSFYDYASNLNSYFLKTSETTQKKNYQLILHDSKMVNKVFQSLNDLGISSVYITKVDHSKIQELRLQTKVAAIKAANVKAKELASAINQHIGKALYIEELKDQGIYDKSASSSNFFIRGGSSLSGFSNQNSTVEFKKIELEYSVLVRFELL